MKKRMKNIIAKGTVLSLAAMMSLAINSVDAQAAAKPKKITITPTSKALTVGQTAKIKVKSVKPSNASKSVTYKSSNTSVASVSSTGVVTAKKAGKVTIKVTSKKNKKAYAKATITVKAKPQKALVIYFTHGENIRHPYKVYDSVMKAEYEAGEEESNGLYDAIASASVQKNSKGKIVGNTGLVGTWIADELGADMYSIHVTQITDDADLYPETKSETQVFFRTYEQPTGLLPKIASMSAEDPDISQYDVIYFGYPNWDGEPPHAVYTFINEHFDELNGKTIVPFAMGHFSARGFDENPLILHAKLPKSVIIDNQFLGKHADFYPSNIATTKKNVISWVKEASAQAATAKPGSAVAVQSTKEKAEKIVGQTLTAAEIKAAVGEWNSKWEETNGCNHELSSVRFYYTGFVIYTVPVDVNGDTASDVKDQITDDTKYQIISIS